MSYPRTSGEGISINDDMFSQSAYPIRFEWGPEGVDRLAPLSGVVVIVDVLSFCTSVDIAVSKDAMVFRIGTTTNQLRHLLNLFMPC